jgi:hypothetical protein
MAAIKRHWLEFLVGTAVVVAGLVWGITLIFTSPARATQQADEAKLDPVAYGELSALREKLCLTDMDLAAMGCTEESAVAIFRALRTWYDSRKVQMSEADVDRSAKLRELHSAFSRMNAGPRDDALLDQVPRLQEALAGSEKDVNDLVLSAAPQVEALLSSSQRALWETARANAGAPSQYRYVPNLTTEQRQSLHLAMRTQARKVAAAQTPEESSDASQAFKASEEDILSSSQKSAQMDVAESMREHMPGVLNAAAKVLPMPEELKPKALPELQAQGR